MRPYMPNALASPTATLLAAALLATTLGACAAPEERPEAAAATAEPEQPGATEAAADWSALLPNARRPLDGVVSGGQPSAAQLEAAAGAGFRTVVNLRTPGEPGELTDEAERVAELGMDYVSLPIAGAAGMTEDNARALAELLAGAERPVLLHCGSGNRIGGLLALEAFYVEGLDVDAALERGLEAGLTRLEPHVREQLEAAAESR